MSIREETPEPTYDTLESFYLSAGLGTAGEEEEEVAGGEPCL